MKKLLLLLALIPSVAFGQPFAKYQPPTPTPWLSTTPGAPGQSTQAFATNEFGQLQTVVVSGGSSGGSTGVTTGTNATFSMTTQATPQVIACNGAGNVKIALSSGAGTGQISIQPSVDGTNFVTNTIPLWVQNSTASAGQSPFSTYSVGNGSTVFSVDCTSFSKIQVFVQVSGTGAVGLTWGFNSTANHVIVDGLNPGTGNALLGKSAKNTTYGSQDSILGTGGFEQDVLTAPAANGNYIGFQQDKLGRQYVNDFGSDVSHAIKICSSANTGTGAVAIVAAGAAGIRNVIRSIACTNSSATASAVTFQDGATAVDTGFVSANTVGEASFQHTFPYPIYGTAATALNFTMGTTATSTVCCAQGYTSNE